MAHFVELNENNFVTQVIVIDNNDCLNADGIEDEAIGKNFCELLFGGRWIQTSFNAKFRNKFAGVGDYYDELEDAFIDPWWINKYTGKPFEPTEWEYLQAYKYFTTSYRFYASIPFNSDSNPILDYCNNTDDFKYAPFDYVTHGTYKLKTDVGSAVQYSEEKGLQVNIWFVHEKVIDGLDIGVIMHEKTNFFDFEIATKARQLHPQVAAASIHELFRLLLEWDYVFTEFGNTEPAAARSHELLVQLNMPVDVRNELLTQVPDQAVALYIKGLQPFISFEPCPQPPLFAEWYNSIKLV